ncbi:MAG TPA: PAS domain-containing protein, partial [Steroidobacteraceae bacterium]|nr:PAS domain-containing protein [Steroidobacteraceae bacterium]
MSLISIPRAPDTPGILRLRLRVAFEALTVTIGSGAFALLVAGLSGGLRRLGPGGCAAMGLLAVLCGVIYFVGRKESQRSQRELTKQQERLAVVIEGTGVAYWEAHVGTDQIYISERWSQMLGLHQAPDEPISQQRWRSLVHPDDLAKVDTVVAECFRNRDYVYQLDFRLR